MRRRQLSSDDLLRHYYTRVYRKTASYRAAAEVLEVDWRTVRDRVDPDLLRALQPEGGGN